MTSSFPPMYRLSARGGVGLACDEQGIALGPVILVEALAAGLGRVFRPRPAEEIARTLALAYDDLAPTDIARCLASLDVAAKALAAGDLAKASVAAVLLKLPDLSVDGFAKLAADPSLKKYSPDQPRDGRGRWTSDGGADSDRSHAGAQVADASEGMTDAGGSLPLQTPANETGGATRVPMPVVPPPPPGTGEVRLYSSSEAAKLPPPPPGSKYVTLSDGSVPWTAPYKELKGGPMLVPNDVSLEDNARAGQRILAEYKEDAEIDPSTAAGISDGKMKALLRRGGEMDYQRTYGAHGKINQDYVDVGNYNYGVVAAAAGYSWAYAASAATIVNWGGSGDKSGFLGSNPRNLEIARRGYDDYKAGKIIQPGK